MPHAITIGIAGHAPNTASNAQSLLEDMLHLGTPDEDGYYAKSSRWNDITVYFLLTDGAVPKGLEPAVRLAMSIDGAELHLVTDEVSGRIRDFAESSDTVSEVADPLSHLISELDTAHGVLCIGWNEEDADDTELIRLAHERNITVRHLVEGLTEIVPGDEGQPSEPAPTEPASPVHRRPPAPARDDLDAAPEELEEALPEQPAREEPQEKAPSTLEDEVAHARRSHGSQTTIAVGAITVDDAALREMARVMDRAAYYMRAVDATNAAKNLAEDTVYSPLTEALGQQVKALNELLYPEFTYEDTLTKPEKKPRGDGKRFKVIQDEETGEWKRAGRGRTRAGVKSAWSDSEGNIYDTAN